MVVNAEPTKANKTTPGSERQSLLKNDLTGPTLLEMSDYRSVNQALEDVLVIGPWTCENFDYGDLDEFQSIPSFLEIEPSPWRA